MQLDVPAFAKAVESLELGATVTLDHHGNDCQLAFWGKLAAGASQPSLQKLEVEVSPFIFELGSFDSIAHLYESNSFDWGGASSAWQLSKAWKLDAQVHKHVYKKLVEELGAESALGQLITKELEQRRRSRSRVQL